MIMNWLRRLGFYLKELWIYRTRYIYAKIELDTAGIWLTAEDDRALNLNLTYKGRDVPCYGVLIRSINNKDYTYLDGIPVKKKK